MKDNNVILIGEYRWEIVQTISREQSYWKSIYVPQRLGLYPTLRNYAISNSRISNVNNKLFLYNLEVIDIKNFNGEYNWDNSTRSRNELVNNVEVDEHQ